MSEVINNTQTDEQGYIPIKPYLLTSEPEINTFICYNGLLFLDFLSFKMYIKFFSVGHIKTGNRGRGLAQVKTLPTAPACQSSDGTRDPGSASNSTSYRGTLWELPARALGSLSTMEETNIEFPGFGLPPFLHCPYLTIAGIWEAHQRTGDFILSLSLSLSSSHQTLPVFSVCKN